jgi:uncharacterized protein YjbI with pentapeptide repeats
VWVWPWGVVGPAALIRVVRHVSSIRLSRWLVIAANLGGDLTGANLSGVDLRVANLTGARNLTQAQLDQACGN